MKKLLFLIVLFCSNLSLSLSFGQTYQLIGDSCMRCNYQQNLGGGQTIYDIQYIFDPNDTMTVNGITYSKFSENYSSSSNVNGSIEGVRQVGNKLFGSTNDEMEYLVMDFDALPGDTIYNLYSNSVFYNAKVDSLDSTVRADGTYHHFLYLTGFEHGGSLWNPDSTWNPSEEWPITWNELGLCGINTYHQVSSNLNCIGGYTFNVPSSFYNISGPSIDGYPCTTDPRYLNMLGVCPSCYADENSVQQLESIEFELFPNPSSDNLQLRFSDSNKKEVTVLSAYGQEIEQFATTEIENNLSIAHLPNGIYFLSVTTEKLRSIRKFIKN